MTTPRLELPRERTKTHTTTPPHPTSPCIFVLRKGHGVDPTTALLIGLVLTLSECSPTSPSPLPTSKMSMSDGGVVSQRGQSAAVAAIASGRGGSGLSAGTDALRLACLQCLEVGGRVGRWVGDFEGRFFC